jgi:beta-N-acetylhexosaminidase
VSERLSRLALAVLQPGFTGLTPPDWLRRALADGLGGVALFGRNIASPEQVAALTEALRAERADLLVAIDEEGGDVTRLETAAGSSWPGNLALGMAGDVGLTEAVARELGRDLAAVGVNLDYAPSADVNSNPDNPVIGVRSFGGDAHQVAAHTAAYVRGLQAVGVAACAKHFPGHGDTAVDSHHGLPYVREDLDTLLAGALVPFQAAIEAGTLAVMSAHIVLPALDDLPATVSPLVLTGLLRDRLGYQGLVVTDGVEMAGVAAAYGVAGASVRALIAGADAICVGGGLADEQTVLSLRDAILAAVADGSLPAERLAEAAGRVAQVAEWTRTHRTRTALLDGALPGDRELGLVAARRALRVTGAVTPLTTAPHLIEFAPVANIAVGDETRWGLADALSDVFAGTTVRRSVEGDADVAELARPAAGRPLVLVVRDLHRHDWIAALAAALLARRPDATVVEMGLPYAPPSGASHIATHGASRASAIAATEVLLGASPVSPNPT